MALTNLDTNIEYENIIVTYKLDGPELKRRRKRKDITANAFAIAAGWSKPYQSKLESKNETIISETTLRLIKAILRKLK